MMKVLQPADLASWNERFASFNDALVKRWNIDFALTPPTLETVIEAQDQASPSGWSLVTIRLKDVSSLRFCEGPKASYQVLSNGLHALFEEDRVALEFGDFIDLPDSLAELISSPCHAVAKELEWEAQPVSQ